MPSIDQPCEWPNCEIISNLTCLIWVQHCLCSIELQDISDTDKCTDWIKITTRFEGKCKFKFIRGLLKQGHHVIYFFSRNYDVVRKLSLMSRIERKYCVISTSYLAGFLDIFTCYFWFIFDQNCVCFDDSLPMRTLCDAHAIIRNLNLISDIQSWTYL